MAKHPKKERDARQKGSMAEEFKLTSQAAWKAPSLEQMYWGNPNSSRGDISRCAYKDGYVSVEVHTSEGI